MRVANQQGTAYLSINDVWVETDGEKGLVVGDVAHKLTDGAETAILGTYDSLERAKEVLSMIVEVSLVTADKDLKFRMELS